MLDKYLHILCEKEHILNSRLTLEFFELEHLINNIDNYLPIKKIDFQSSSKNFPNIIDFLYSLENNILFIASNRENISFFSSIFSDTPKYLSELMICFCYKNEKYEYQIKTIKKLQLEQRITKLKVILNKNNYDLNIIFISFEDGTINIYNLYKDLNFEFIGNIQLHDKKIIDFGIDINSGFIYSIAENEKKIVISEFNYQKIISIIKITFYPYSFHFDYFNHKIIISDKDGSIYIYKIVNLINLILLQAIYSQNKKPINYINLIKERNFLFTTILNKIIFYDFIETENFQFTINKRFELLSLDKNSTITNIQFRSYKSEIIISTNNGNIEFWSHNLNYPNLKIKTQFKSISKMYYNEKNNILIILGDNKFISIYELPNYYPSDLIREDKTKNDFSIVENLTQNKDKISLLKEAISRLSFGTISTSEDTQKNDQSIINNFDSIISDEKIEDDDNSSLDGWELFETQQQINDEEMNYFETKSCKF